MKPYQLTWPDIPTNDLLKLFIDRTGFGVKEIDYREWASPAFTEYMHHVLRVLHRFPERGDLRSYAAMMRSTNEVGGFSPYQVPRDGIYSVWTFLSPGAEPPLVVFDGTERSGTHTFVLPQTGLTVAFQAPQAHGVLNFKSGAPCIALITQSIRQ